MIHFLEQIPISVIAQAFGFLAMSIAISGYLQKDDTKVKKIFMCSTSIWMIHFALMGMFSAVAACFMSFIRIFLSLKYQRNKRIFIGVLAGTITLGVMTMDGHMSLLPIIGSCISAYGFFFYERIKLRMFMMVSSLFWLTFNVHIQSVGGIVNDVLVQTILIITMVKMVHEEHKRTFIMDKIMKILHKTHDAHLPDVGRYITAFDFIHKTRKWLLKLAKKQKNIYKKLLQKKVKSAQHGVTEVTKQKTSV